MDRHDDSDSVNSPADESQGTKRFARVSISDEV